jgi:hypothetical protein
MNVACDCVVPWIGVGVLAVVVVAVGIFSVWVLKEGRRLHDEAKAFMDEGERRRRAR